MAKKTKKLAIMKSNPNINRIKRHNFPHGNYRIHWRKPVGSDAACTDPNDRQIWIDPKTTDRELIKLLIDESLHASAWILDNEAVDEMSESIGEFLYKIGFRLEKKK